MIDLSTIRFPEHYGAWITFQYMTGDKVCGRLKIASSSRIFAVFSADNNWRQFDQYTAQGCDPEFCNWSIDEVTDLYCDGGVIGPNPSAIGGTWAWLGVNETNEKVMEWSGYVPAPESRPVTNNHTEQMAITLALEAMPEGWSGTVHSDSSVALGRVFKDYKKANLPSNIIERSVAAVARAGILKHEKLKGHPSKQELKNGFAKGGLPVSKWNKRCDDLCNIEARRYKQKISSERIEVVTI